MQPQRTCSNCQKPEVRSNGLCRACLSAKWRREHPQRYLELQKASVARRRDYYLAYHRNYYQTRRNKQDSARRAQEWYAANPDRAKRNSHALYLAHRVARIAQQRAYQISHPLETRENYHRYRARKRAGFVEAVDWDAIYERDRGICQWYRCRKPVERRQMSLDHIVPVSEGGSHEPKNVQLMHLRCNQEKSDTGSAQTRMFG